jgi:hypothetical protein
MIGQSFCHAGVLSSIFPSQITLIRSDLVRLEKYNQAGKNSWHEYAAQDLAAIHALATIEP